MLPEGRLPENKLINWSNIRDSVIEHFPSNTQMDHYGNGPCQPFEGLLGK